jgi:hypothetical protein
MRPLVSDATRCLHCCPSFNYLLVFYDTKLHGAPGLGRHQVPKVSHRSWWWHGAPGLGRHQVAKGSHRSWLWHAPPPGLGRHLRRRRKVVCISLLTASCRHHEATPQGRITQVMVVACPSPPPWSRTPPGACTAVRHLIIHLYFTRQSCMRPLVSDATRCLHCCPSFNYLLVFYETKLHGAPGLGRHQVLALLSVI